MYIKFHILSPCVALEQDDFHCAISRREPLRDTMQGQSGGGWGVGWGWVGVEGGGGGVTFHRYAHQRHPVPSPLALRPYYLSLIYHDLLSPDLPIISTSLISTLLSQSDIENSSYHVWGKEGRHEMTSLCCGCILLVIP